MKKLRVLFLLLILTLLSQIFVYAESETTTNLDTLKGIEITPYFTNIVTFSNAFDISPSGLATLTSSIYSNGTDSAKIVMYLQRYQSGAWTNVKSWTDTQTGSYMLMERTYSVASGYQYRMKNYAYVYSGGVFVESTVHTSPTIVY